MSTLIIIPARMNSSRFPGKPLKKILNKTLIEHCYIRAKIAVGSDNVFVASCDEEIKKKIIEIGGNYIHTSNKHVRATTRTAEALVKIEKKLNHKFQNVIMYQGDEPFILPSDLKKIIYLFKSNLNIDVANLVYKTKSRKIINDKNNVKVVSNSSSKALYFSREAIPSSWLNNKNYYSLIQTGIIAFKRDRLFQFNKFKQSYLEITESVDMNRLLELSNFGIHLLISNNYYLSIDTKQELNYAKKIMENDKIYANYI